MGAIVLVPLMVVGGIVAAMAALVEIASGWFNVFDFSEISAFDWLTGGPGATSGSGTRYVAFMIGGIAAALSYTGLVNLWRWASSESEPKR
jgi:hypothetical protein